MGCGYPFYLDHGGLAVSVHRYQSVFSPECRLGSARLGEEGASQQCLAKAIAIKQSKPGLIRPPQTEQASMPVMRIEKSAMHTTSFHRAAARETATIMVR